MTVARFLIVDPIACSGEGVCADLFPEWIHLDDWGFPIIDPRPVPADRLAAARWAAGNCPALALKLGKSSVG
jgi:ferredoxin